MGPTTTFSLAPKFKPVTQASERTVKEWEERLVAELAERARGTSCPRKREAIRNLLSDAGTGAVVGCGLASEAAKRYQAAIAHLEG